MTMRPSAEIAQDAIALITLTLAEDTIVNVLLEAIDGLRSRDGEELKDQLMRQAATMTILAKFAAAGMENLQEELGFDPEHMLQKLALGFAAELTDEEGT